MKFPPNERPTPQRRIENLRAIANDATVNNFARSVCAEAAKALQEYLDIGATVPFSGYGAIVCKTTPPERSDR